ncbi:hypothetical protein Taro_037303 [Colocasia esculenta]|uniref:Uncharacterized protein n=1 Tax=Colocasia esculenta TaxID=4460 RepID=A0A843WKF0_COLES|nr:hypothetical protein [Colocasia esculenta]
MDEDQPHILPEGGIQLETPIPPQDDPSSSLPLTFEPPHFPSTFQSSTSSGGSSIPPELFSFLNAKFDTLNPTIQIMYKHFYAKDESTHPSMVSTHQHRFKAKCVDTLSEQVDTRSRFQNSQFEELGQQVDTLSEQVDTTPSSQNSQFAYLGQQVDTLKSKSTRDPLPRTAFYIFWTVCRHYHQGSLHKREGQNSLRASKKLLEAKKSSCLLPLLSKCFQKTNSHQFKTSLKHSKEADPVEDFLGEEFEEDPTSQIAEHRLGLQASQMAYSKALEGTIVMALII